MDMFFCHIYVFYGLFFLIFVIIFNPYFILMTSLSSDTSCMFSSYTLRFFVCISFVIALLCAPWRRFPLKWNYRIAFYSFPSLFLWGEFVTNVVYWFVYCCKSVLFYVFNIYFVFFCMYYWKSVKRRGILKRYCLDLINNFKLYAGMLTYKSLFMLLWENAELAMICNYILSGG